VRKFYIISVKEKSDYLTTDLCYHLALRRMGYLLYKCCCYWFHGWSPLVCVDLELTSETVDLFRHFGRTPWMGYRPIARPRLTKDSKTQKNADTNPSNGILTHEPSVRVIRHHTHLRPPGHWDRLCDIILR
jgi:hypothetical protein